MRAAAYLTLIGFVQVAQLVQDGHVQNVIVSPGPGTPGHPQDVGIVVDIFRELADVPILGVCLGHQALAAANGGAVVRAPVPVHGRLSAIVHDQHPLFDGIPSGGQAGFQVVRYHSLLVDAQALPTSLQPICWTEGADAALQLSSDPGNTAGASRQQASQDADSLAGLLMGLAHTAQPHYGVQFHPESVATAHGAQLMRNFSALAAAHVPAPAPAPKGLPAWLLARRPPWQACSTAGHPCTSSAPPLQLGFRRVNCNTVPDGADVMAALGWAGGADTFWLDSADAQRGRFSFLGGPGGPLWRRIECHVASTADQSGGAPAAQDAQPAVAAHSNARTVRHAGADEVPAHASEHHQARSGHAATGSMTITTALGAQVSEAGPLHKWLARFLAVHRVAEHGAHTQLPFDFHGGLVGYLGYELKAECGGSCAHASRCVRHLQFLCCICYSEASVAMLSSISFKKLWTRESPNMLARACHLLFEPSVHTAHVRTSGTMPVS